MRLISILLALSVTLAATAMPFPLAANERIAVASFDDSHKLVSRFAEALGTAAEGLCGCMLGEPVGICLKSMNYYNQHPCPK